MSRPSIYDDPGFLGYVMAEFMGRFPRASVRLSQPVHKDHLYAAALWKGFKEGVEFAVDEGLKGDEH